MLYCLVFATLGHILIVICEVLTLTEGHMIVLGVTILENWSLIDSKTAYGIFATEELLTITLIFDSVLMATLVLRCIIKVLHTGDFMHAVESWLL